jgi:hypothetical protein
VKCLARRSCQISQAKNKTAISAIISKTIL